MKPARVYKIEVVYPEGSDAPGWYPPIWDNREYLMRLPRKLRRQVPAMKSSFRWPKERLYLSSSGAYGRATLLHIYGASAEVVSSDPVTWPGETPPEPAPADPGPTAAELAAVERDRAEAREHLRADAAMWSAPDLADVPRPREAADVQDR